LAAHISADRSRRIETGVGKSGSRDGLSVLVVQELQVAQLSLYRSVTGIGLSANGIWQ